MIVELVKQNGGDEGYEGGNIKNNVRVLIKISIITTTQLV